jgi:hypothetical protein
VRNCDVAIIAVVIVATAVPSDSTVCYGSYLERELTLVWDGVAEIVVSVWCMKRAIVLARKCV